MSIGTDEAGFLKKTEELERLNDLHAVLREEALTDGKIDEFEKELLDRVELKIQEARAYLDQQRRDQYGREVDPATKAAQKFEQTVDPQRVADEMGQAGEALTDGVTGPIHAVSEGGSALSGAVERTGRALHEYDPEMGEVMAEEGRKSGGLIGEVTAGAIGEIGEGAVEITGAIAGHITEEAGKAAKDLSKDVGKMGDAVDDILDGDVIDGGKDLFKSAATTGKDVVKGAGRLVYGTAKGAGEGIYEVGEAGVEVAGAVAVPVVEALADTFVDRGRKFTKHEYKGNLDFKDRKAASQNDEPDEHEYFNMEEDFASRDDANVREFEDDDNISPLDDRKDLPKS